MLAVKTGTTLTNTVYLTTENFTMAEVYLIAPTNWSEMFVTRLEG